MENIGNVCVARSSGVIRRGHEATSDFIVAAANPMRVCKSCGCFFFQVTDEMQTSDAAEKAKTLEVKLAAPKPDLSAPLPDAQLPFPAQALAPVPIPALEKPIEKTVETPKPSEPTKVEKAK